MEVLLSPLAYCDFTIPNSVALDDPAAVQVFETAQQPGVIAFHKLDETVQCELFGVAFDCLVKNRFQVVPKVNSIRVEVSLHEKRAPNDPVDCCGITFYVRIRIKLECNASMPVFNRAVSHTILIRYNLPDSKPTSRACIQAH